MLFASNSGDNFLNINKLFPLTKSTTATLLIYAPFKNTVAELIFVFKIYCFSSCAFIVVIKKNNIE